MLLLIVIDWYAERPWIQVQGLRSSPLESEQVMAQQEGSQEEAHPYLDGGHQEGSPDDALLEEKSVFTLIYLMINAYQIIITTLN